MLVVDARGDPNVVGVQAFQTLFKTYYRLDGVSRRRPPVPQARWSRAGEILKQDGLGIMQFRSQRARPSANRRKTRIYLFRSAPGNTELSRRSFTSDVTMTKRRTFAGSCSSLRHRGTMSSGIMRTTYSAKRWLAR